MTDYNGGRAFVRDAAGNEIRVATATELDAGIGAAQTVRLLGPYRVNFDTAGQSAAFGAGGTVEVGEDLPIGSVILSAWPITVSDFVTGDALSVLCSIGVGANGVPDDNMTLLSSGWQVRVVGSSVPEFDAQQYAPGAVDTGVWGVALAREAGSRLAAYLVLNGGNATAGALDIYVLIATPSA